MKRDNPNGRKVNECLLGEGGIGIVKTHLQSWKIYGVIFVFKMFVTKQKEVQ